MTTWEELEAMPHPTDKTAPPSPRTRFTRALLGLPSENGSQGPISAPQADPPPPPPYLPDKSVDPVAFNQSAEARFRRILDALTANGETPTTAYVLGYAAFELDISTATANRYLAKLTIHPRAPFMVEQGKVKRRQP